MGLSLNIYCGEVNEDAGLASSYETWQDLNKQDKKE
jgi:hypothetical protein